MRDSEIVVAFVAAALVVCIILGAVDTERMAKECRARGGAFIYRDRICMRPEFVIPVDHR